MDVDTVIPRWQGPLAGFFAARGADPMLASELAQDALVRCYLARDRFAGDWSAAESIGPWLRGIARNVWRAHCRQDVPLSGVGEDDVVSDDPGPAASAMESSERRAVRRAVDALPARHREVIWMFYFDQASTRDVAALLGIRERAVEGRLYKARAVLRQRLAPFAPTVSQESV